VTYLITKYTNNLIAWANAVKIRSINASKQLEKVRKVLEYGVENPKDAHFACQQALELMKELIISSETEK
jgi:hypothetical protein